MLNRTRRCAAAALVVPAMLLATACGGSGAPTTPGSTNGRSTDTAVDGAPQAGPHADKAALISAMTAATAELKSAHVTMNLKTGKDGQDIAMKGDVVTDSTSPSMKFSMTVAQLGEMEMIVVDKTIYLKGMPGVGAGKWVSMDENSTVGKQLQGSLSQADPRRMYANLEKAMTDVKFVATETVDGAQLHKYAVTMDSAKVEGLSVAGVTLPTSITYDIWLDSEDRIRKVTFEFSGISADMRIDDYNKPLEIKAPEAADLTKVPGV